MNDQDRTSELTGTPNTLSGLADASADASSTGPASLRAAARRALLAEGAALETTP